ncbi:hypothetical protein [Aquibium oceanicum]|uniref:Uncharacterized protein n=1 Tax=Aquibium oceanicum TaxID=1670800 RepID=A0A1L3SSK0_9HYPH|nr:hypothetical protein [Aquibium oceanicum]APH72305.1 hypothetical protein BSQ44_13730 [Aquibium oceanicum]
MKLVALTIALAAVAAPAQAISRYNSLDMSCAQVQSAVAREGAVILRYPSKRKPSLTLYDRYVEHGGFCAVGEYAANDWIPTADKAQCFVRACKPVNYDDDVLFN